VINPFHPNALATAAMLGAFLEDKTGGYLPSLNQAAAGMVRCKKCGALWRPRKCWDVNYCSKCGEPFTGEQEEDDD